MRNRPGSDVNVVLMAGMGRSGSTVLGDVLGTADRTVHVGELVRLPRMLRAGRPCDCGQPLTACDVWRGPAALLTAHDGPVVSLVDDVAWPREPGVLAAVYGAIADATGATTIVDGSKHPAFAAYALDQTQGAVGILHLVRDVRGVVHSRVTRGRTRRLEGAGPGRTAASAARDTLRWVVRNEQARRLADRTPRSLLVRYEDFAVDPGGVLDAISRTFAVTRPAASPAGTWSCEERHCVWGNRGREVGTIHVRADTRWLHEMPPGLRALVSTLGLPGLVRFGYVRAASRASQGVLP